MSRLAVLALSAVFLGACTPPIDVPELREMLLQPSRGLIGGVEIGDSWDKLKAQHDPRWTVREDTVSGSSFYQLRHDLSSNAGENGFFLSFKLDAKRNITEVTATIYGEKRNAVVIRDLLDEVRAHFALRAGHGKCFETPGSNGNSSVCHYAGKDGGPQVEVKYLHMPEYNRGQVEATVSAKKR